MKVLLDRIKAEPVLFQGAFKATLLMLMAFGLKMTAEQMASIMVCVETVLTFATRSQVTPNHVVAQKVEVALNTPVPEKPKE